MVNDIIKAAVLPARAGMIPRIAVTKITGNGAPRESGDDPKGRFPRPDGTLCSPRERG